ncbi:MAG: heme exporter protein CcmB [Alphaproteobacteria bacterium]|nr:heme exporter protein CcmB [Alphaproteobacteria bacterium]
MRTAFLALLRRDIYLSVRQEGGSGVALGFLLVVVSLLPFGVGPDLGLLRQLAPGLLWTALLLATLLTLDRLFISDYEDGLLELFMTASLPLELAVVAKAFSHWLTTTLPLAFAAPLFGIVLNLESIAVLPLIATMLIGGLTLSFVGTIGAALTLTLRRGGLLTAILILPFYIPVLIFGILSIDAALVGPLSFGVPFMILVSMALCAMSLTPFAAAAALRSALE